MNNFISF